MDCNTYGRDPVCKGSPIAVHRKLKVWKKMTIDMLQYIAQMSDVLTF